MQSTIQPKTLTRKEIHPTMLRTSKFNAFSVFSENFSISQNLKSTSAYSLSPFPSHPPLKFQFLGISGTYRSLFFVEVFTMFNRTSLQSHIPPVSVTGQSHDLFLTEQKFNPSGSIKSIHEDRENFLCIPLFILCGTQKQGRVQEEESRKYKMGGKGQFQKITLLKKHMMKNI